MTRVADLLPKTLATVLSERVLNRRANWIEVARMDLANARRSSMLWALSGVLGLLMLLFPLLRLLLVQIDPTELPADFGVEALGVVIWLLGPLAGLIVGSMAVVGEKEAGSLRMLLGLPITRRDVVIGKLLGRAVVMAGVLLPGLALASVELWYVFGPFDFVWYGQALAAIIGYVLLFVWIGVGISAFFRSSAVTLSAAVSAYALFVLVWRVIPRWVYYLVEGQFPENIPFPWDPPAWFVFLGNANPFYGYASMLAEWSIIAPGPARDGTIRYQSYTFEGTVPFYLQPEFLLAVMLIWGIVPLLIGTWRFTRSDL